MLPLKLTLKNFMPYRGPQEPLNLEGLGIACLSGPNGAGKSALLDAITWALWGRSRAGGSADQLVATGMSDMSVQLAFRSHGVDYRVQRQHQRSNRGRTTVDFQMREGDRWRPLNERTATETNHAIRDTIRLDYDTFINSAFLVQGKADLFMTVGRADRKEILGKILNLSIYDGYAQQARGIARDARNRQAITHGQIEAIDRELEQEEGVNKQAEEVRRELADLSAALETTIKRRDELNAAVADLRDRQRQLREAQERMAALTEEIDALSERRAALQGDVERAEQTLTRTDEIMAGWQALEQTRARLNALGESSRRHGGLITERGRLERVALEEKAQLENALTAAAQRHEDIAAQAALLPDLESRWNAARAEQKGLRERETELAARQAERDEMNGRLGELRAAFQALKTENGDLETQFTRITANPTAECPVCGTELGQHGMGRVREHFEQRRSAIAIEMERITADGTALSRSHDTLTAEIARDEAAANEEAARASREIGSLQAQVEQAQQAAERLPDAVTALEKARAALTALPEESDELRNVRRQITDLNYDADAHTAAQEHEEGLRHWENERRELDGAANRLTADRSALEDVNQRRQRSMAAHEAEGSRITALEQGLEGLDDAVAEIGKASSEADELAERIRIAQQEQTRAETRLEQLAQRRDEKTRLAAEERTAASRASVHAELTEAFGKGGVQALLIETALPELEDDANTLLGQMTNGSMTLRLETQRQAQTTGNIIETLDVVVSDIEGTRPYEMYSGGEAFRINFALRIALSKLLARRAGAEVPVLFIDEGFGSQDAEGRERLIEAIAALRRDPVFQDGLILVITHIDDIRNQFDTRIDITKTDSGSRYSLAV